MKISDKIRKKSPENSYVTVFLEKTALYEVLCLFYDRKNKKNKKIVVLFEFVL
ncbi:hypothetical protein HRQ91_01060 [Treponema parvum]|uniref:Uncharacterized protein n=1 Tax=Treponema parvum TaxID=138851 RepID=A0A975IEC8_9SPIR|nr:hypothetical protein [Treponema parvum]QTQ13154.1 hypothetical protein HRQ91_01060 [Treponema parvum]